MRKKLKIGVFVLVFAAVATGVAIAAWTMSGNGNAYGKAANASALTLGDASGSVTGDLYPGGTGTLKVSVTNPNDFPVTVTSVTLQGGGSVTSNVAGCNSGGHGVTFTNQTGLSTSIAAGATTTLSLAGALAMSSSSVDACQGALFTVPVTVTATT